MKILICGKGGSGKSTVTALAARCFSQQGKNVLVVDSDESNQGLARLLGIKPPESLLDNMGGKAGLREKLKAVSDLNSMPLLNQKLTMDQLPGSCLGRADGLSLLTVGKIKAAGEGCACMMGVLAKRLLSNLILWENDLVLVDAEAGVEHFGRGVDQECDIVVAVVDPTYESFTLAKRMLDMAGQVQKTCILVGNRMDETAKAAMEKHLGEKAAAVLIPPIGELFAASLEGRPAQVDLPEIATLCEKILSLA